MCAVLAQRASSVVVSLYVFALVSGFAVGAMRSDYEALFVFGDSYADTGNHNKYDPALDAPWQAPYGITWPGHPSGRYSDGSVFTDFFAYSLYLESPLPYRVIETIPNVRGDGLSTLRSFGGGGINFAFGGSGVFPTFGPQYPNISAQIDELWDLVLKGFLSRETLASCIVLLVVAGNDYTAFLQTHSTNEIAAFIPDVVANIIASLEELFNMGFRTLTVTNMEPVGCLPYTTQANNYRMCNNTANSMLSIAHNDLLEYQLSTLQTKYANAEFILLDLYSSFEAVLRGTNLALRPCCEGINGSDCGDIDSQGGLLYKVCSTPDQSLFWDIYHPSSAGWKAISKALFCNDNFSSGRNPCRHAWCHLDTSQF